MNITEIQKAYQNIKDVIIKTPLLYSNIFSDLSNNTVYLKCENLQLTGAYKIRGALNKIRNLTEEEKTKGVVCSSAGNHAQGVAYASKLLNINSTIVMPKTTPYLKVKSTKDLGGNVLLHGDVYDDAYQKAKDLEKEGGLTFIHPFDDFDIIAGQGTIALEILEEVKDLDVILCPIGGGGLISGISIVAKELNPNIKIIGVQALGAPSMYNSFKTNKRIKLDNVKTIADGIAVKVPGEKTFNLIKELVDEIVLVSDDEIAEAFLTLSEKHKILAEGAGLVSLAALKKITFKNKKISCIISGGNIDMLTISSLINSSLVSKGRLSCFNVELPNKPGELLKVSTLLAKCNANIVKLEHNQFKALNKINNVVLEVTIETNGHEHIESIIKSFGKEGYSVEQMY